MLVIEGHRRNEGMVYRPLNRHTDTSIDLRHSLPIVRRGGVIFIVLCGSRSELLLGGYAIEGAPFHGVAFQ
jgi:hypothetical protein